MQFEAVACSVRHKGLSAPRASTGKLTPRGSASPDREAQGQTDDCRDGAGGAQARSLRPGSSVRARRSSRLPGLRDQRADQPVTDPAQSELDRQPAWRWEMAIQRPWSAAGLAIAGTADPLGVRWRRWRALLQASDRSACRPPAEHHVRRRRRGGGPRRVGRGRRRCG